MKIAIMHCRRSSNVCTGAACFRAYNACEKSFQQYAGNKPTLAAFFEYNACEKSFQQYAGNKPTLAAFFDCGGCGIDRSSDPGMQEKMEALKRIGVEKIHLGICMKENKPTLAAFFDCGGCGIDRSSDPGMQEKMEALKRIGVEKIHLGICMKETCPDFSDIAAMLKRYEIPFELGTH